jgi:hypothetical protein
MRRRRSSTRAPAGPNLGSDIGTLDVVYDYAAIHAQIDPAELAADPDSSIGRFWPLLPIAPAQSAATACGQYAAAPCRAPRRQYRSAQTLYVKDDGRNPSASFKDRASAIAVAQALEEGRAARCHGEHRQRRRRAGGQCAAVGHGQRSSLCPKPRPRPRSRSCWSTAAVCWLWMAPMTTPSTCAWQASRRLWLVQPQHRLQPVHERGKKTVSYRDCAAIGCEGARADSRAPFAKSHA